MSRKVGLVLLVLWALVFLCGAIGEIFGVEALQKATDLKRVFLR